MPPAAATAAAPRPPTPLTETPELAVALRLRSPKTAAGLPLLSLLSLSTGHRRRRQEEPHHHFHLAGAEAAASRRRTAVSLFPPPLSLFLSPLLLTNRQRTGTDERRYPRPDSRPRHSSQQGDATPPLGSHTAATTTPTPSVFLTVDLVHIGQGMEEEVHDTV